jgi:RHS repeat-associated protein
MPPLRVICSYEKMSFFHVPHDQGDGSRPTAAAYNASNQITWTSVNAAGSNFTYDAAGNVTYDGKNSYAYDGEGRICAVASTPVPGMTAMTGYLYDADGARVAKGRISAWSCDPGVNGFQTTSDYILGPGGEQVTEMGMDANNSMAWQHTNVYAAGKLLATYDNDGLHFYFNDPLGTRRAQTDYAGVLEQTCSSLPFGDGLNCITPPNSSGNSYAASLIAPTEHHFTGKERDTESGNDYFPARYYASSMGRWISPDTGWILAVHKANPQTWNLYSYVVNNPLDLVDPYGYIPCSQQMDLQHNGVGRASIWCNIGSFFKGLFGGGSAIGGNGGSGGGSDGGGVSVSIPNVEDIGLRVNYDTGYNANFRFREIQYQLYNKTNDQPVTHQTYHYSLFIYETHTFPMYGLSRVGDFFADTQESHETFTFTDQLAGFCYIFCSTITSTQRFYVQRSGYGYDPSASYPLTIDNGGQSYNSLDIRIKQMSVLWPSLFSPNAGVQVQNMDRWPGVPAKAPKQ